jgi:hypothetical protein
MGYWILRISRVYDERDRPVLIEIILVIDGLAIQELQPFAPAAGRRLGGAAHGLRIGLGAGPA